MKKRIILTLLLLIGLATAGRASASDELCDPAFEDCRTRLINLIRAETVGIDVAFWFMEDARYTTELVKKAQAGVKIRVLVDTDANDGTPANATRIAELVAAGIPVRNRHASGILHWKMMLFSNSKKLQFSAANYSPDAFRPSAPYQNYTDEAIYFTDDQSIVNSFRKKYDDAWTDTVNFRNYANITTPLERKYDDFCTPSPCPKDPELNFPPIESFRSRSIPRYDAERSGVGAIDVIMYRITDAAHADAMIRAVKRGVPVRLLTEQEQYRDPKRFWHSYNVDRMYMAGIEVRDRGHDGLIHQKTTILRDQKMVIFGSSNWTSSSSSSQLEHNYFTKKPYFYQWFSDQFDRKWNNLSGIAESEPFVPLPPTKAIYSAPANDAQNQSTGSVTLRWDGGLWAHVYDVYVGITPDPPLAASNLALGPSETPADLKTLTISNLQPGTRYYWKVVSKTMADMKATGPIYSFTTTGTAVPPPSTGELGVGDVLVYASRATITGTDWRRESDNTAAGGVRITNPDSGRAKVTDAEPDPDSYVELTFTAAANTPYRVWMRLRGANNYWPNDSVNIQFSDSLDSSGAPAFRIGSTSSTSINLENCSSCGINGWGWQDNGYGNNVLGPTIKFATSGTHTVRFQRREDGVSFDQFLLSPQKFLTAAPGLLKNDVTIFPESDASVPPPPPPPSGTSVGDIVLYAGAATVVVGDWERVTDASAAGGAYMLNPNHGVGKASPSATPLDYFEMTFQAPAGTPYRLWMRSRAQSDSYNNDSLHVQFSDSQTQAGVAAYRIGTVDSTVVVLEDCGGCGVRGWGWQDNGYDGLGPLIMFQTSGTHTIRIQKREDGIGVDQILLSPTKYLSASPGLLKDDNTILSAASGGSTP